MTFSQFVRFLSILRLPLIYEFKSRKKMSFINKLFGGSGAPKPEKLMPWKALSSVDQLELISEKSKTKTQLIFKHSTRCGISKMVLNQFVEAYDVDLPVDIYYLDLLNYRDVSSEVGYRFQLLHESPQLLIIKNGNTVAHASHGAINSLNLERYT